PRLHGFCGGEGRGEEERLRNIQHPTSNSQGVARRAAAVSPIGCWMLDVGCWMLDVGCWMLDVGRWMLDVGCWMLDVGCWMLDVGCSEFRICPTHPWDSSLQRLWTCSRTLALGLARIPSFAGSHRCHFHYWISLTGKTPSLTELL